MCLVQSTKLNLNLFDNEYDVLLEFNLNMLQLLFNHILWCMIKIIYKSYLYIMTSN